MSDSQNEDKQSYRKILIDAEQKSQEHYDKTLVSLAGGALGASLLFIENVIGDKAPIGICFLVSAWSQFALSLALVIASYFISTLALRKAIHQCDANDFSGGAGGWFSTATAWLNAFSGIFFLIGVVLLIVFCSKNIGEENMSSDRKGNVEVTKGYTPPPPPAPVKQPITEGFIPPPPPPPKSK